MIGEAIARRTSFYGHPAEGRQASNGILFFTKEGKIPGSQALISMQPDMQLSFALMINSDAGDVKVFSQFILEAMASAFTKTIFSGLYPLPLPDAGLRLQSALAGMFWAPDDVGCMVVHWTAASFPVPAQLTFQVIAATWNYAGSLTYLRTVGSTDMCRAVSIK